MGHKQSRELHTLDEQTQQQLKYVWVGCVACEVFKCIVGVLVSCS